MKRFILAVIVLIPLSINAQWEILNEGIGEGSLNTIDFVNDVGWVAGREKLLKTVDGGESWALISINARWDIKMIDFVSESIGWAIGKNDGAPVIWKTSNGGDTWIYQLSDNIEFNAIYAVDENNVFAAGMDKIFKTTDGTHWIDISPNLPDRYYHSLYFQDSQSGVVVGSHDDGTADIGIILRTTNSGIDWNETIVYEFNSILDLQFLDSSTGYFRANFDTTYFICKTEDICQNWQIKFQHPYEIFSYQLLDSCTIYSIMEDSEKKYNVMKSINGGINWQYIYSFNADTSKEWDGGPDRIYFNQVNKGFIPVEFGFPLLFESTDGGYNWILQEFTYPLNDIFFLDKDRGFIAGGYWAGSHGHYYTDGHILSTINSGKFLHHNFFTGGKVVSCVFLDERVGFTITGGITGGGGGVPFNEIYKTIDSGNNWYRVHDLINSRNGGGIFTINDISFVNETKGWAVGFWEDFGTNTYGAAILSSTDEGESWDSSKVFPGAYEELHSIDFVDTTGWAVGDNGLIIKYTPQSGWIKQSSITTLPLNKVFFTDDYNGWITGGYQNNYDFQKILLRTTDGGQNWQKNQTISYLINDIQFINSQSGWAVGVDANGKGVILMSTNSGADWETEVENLSDGLKAITIVDNYAWAVGDNGLILRNTNARPVWVEDNNTNIYPTEYKLEQNYPNPFNPATVICYQVPEGSKVILKVYDILGREIKTLVNEGKPPGVYEVEFKSGDLSSGIYFYQLKAGSYRATRKMILLR